MPIFILTLVIKRCFKHLRNDRIDRGKVNLSVKHQLLSLLKQKKACLLNNALMLDSSRYLLISWLKQVFEVYKTYLNTIKSWKIMLPMKNYAAVKKICSSILHCKLGLG